MSKANDGFFPTLFSLWLRLITIGAVAFLVPVIPFFPGMVDNWHYYQTFGEIIFGLAVRSVFVILVGVVVGTAGTLLAAPFVLASSASRGIVAQRATRVAVVIAVFAVFALAVKRFVNPLARLAGLSWFPSMAIFSVAFVIALCIPRRRKQIVNSLDGMLGDKMTRRSALAIGISTAGVVGAEWAMGKGTVARASSAKTVKPAGPNILLVTFDTFAAEDMSLFGYQLPTTPNITAFAAKSSVFSNFYSASTLTTPCVASVLTGLYPTQHRVFHLHGTLSPEKAKRSLPNLMRSAGYATGASVSNPYAYFLAAGLDFDVFPDHPAYRTNGFDIWGLTRPLHQNHPYGSRAREYQDLEKVRDFRPEALSSRFPRAFTRTESGYAPEQSFAQAKEVLDQLPDGFFMWVHLMAPHSPYLPDSPWLHRFLKGNEMVTAEQQESFPYYPRYEPQYQPFIDQTRLRYDEFMGQADNAFASFLSGLERAGRLNNTAVILSADHGESFKGGVYQHGNHYQVRSEMHIPFIVRMPGQSKGQTIALTVDQTSVAPTILDIAGLPRPNWMVGESLVPRMNSDQTGEGEGRAFTQYLASSSIFEPPAMGTVGLIDAQSQYVINLTTGKGTLRSLSEAWSADLDHSAENPSLAHEMRATIYSRFPDLPGQRG